MFNKNALCPQSRICPVDSHTPYLLVFNAHHCCLSKHLRLKPSTDIHAYFCFGSFYLFKWKVDIALQQDTLTRAYHPLCLTRASEGAFVDIFTDISAPTVRALLRRWCSRWWWSGRRWAHAWRWPSRWWGHRGRWCTWRRRHSAWWTTSTSTATSTFISGTST